MSVPIFGGGRKLTQIPNIGLPLKFHVQRWRREWRKVNPDVAGDDTDDVVAVPMLSADLNVSDVVTARNEFERELRRATTDNAVVMVKGPAGFGKTTAMMRVLPDLARQTQNTLIKARDSAPSYELDLIKEAVSAVATSGYEQAKEKCAQFNRMHRPNTAIGLVFKFFDRLYGAALETIFGEDWQGHKIVADMAAQSSHSSVIGTIRGQQPQVWQQMVHLHQEMLEPLRTAPAGCVIVLFMVHDVLHQWTEGGLSRLLSHPDFFQTDFDELWKLEEPTKLIVAVQDEIALKHLIRLHDRRDVEWCEVLFADKASVWDNQHVHLGDAYDHWKDYCSRTIGEVAFADSVAIRRTGVTSENCVGVGALEPYGQTRDGQPWDMYAPTHQMNFAYRERSWWRGFAHHTAILTTEALPVEVFQISERKQPRTVVLDLSDGIHPDGVAELHVIGNLSSKRNSQIATHVREHEANLALFVIANKCSDLDRSTPHVSAKSTRPRGWKRIT